MFSIFSSIVLCFWNLFLYSFRCRGAEESEVVRVRASSKVQHRLAREQEVWQPFIRGGSCHPQGTVEERGSHVWPLRSWFFLRPRLRFLQLQRRERLPRDWARARSYFLRRQSRVRGIPFLEPQQRTWPRLRRFPRLRCVFPQPGKKSMSHID